MNMRVITILLFVIGIVSAFFFVRVLQTILEEHDAPIMSPAWRRRGYFFLFAFGVEAAICLIAAAWLSLHVGTW